MTFIELMIVLVILMLLVGISVPTMMGVYRRGQLSAAARELASLARLARQRAVLTGHHTELEVDQHKGTYRLNLTPEDPHDRFRGTSSEKFSTPMERTRTLGEGGSRVQFQSAESAMAEHGYSGLVKILFYRNGTATPATIVLADDAKRLMTVQIVGATGDVRVGAGPPESLVHPVVTPVAAAASAAAPSPRPSAPAPAAGGAAAGGGLRIKNRGEASQH